jgi:putative copper export protein
VSRILNNFLHDTCTGMWVGCVIVIYTLAMQVPGMPAEAASAIELAQSRVWWLLVLALVGLGVTGGIRLFYWRSQASPGELAAKRAALIWKHIAFLVIYGAGSVWAYGLAFGTG